MKKLYTLLSLVLLSVTSSAQVVISQAYGGGGNSGATYTHDFVELFNAGTTAVNLNGWSVQYASATGVSWVNMTILPDFTLQPGQYYLIQEAQGAGGTTPLPTPDLTTVAGTGGNQIALGGTNFKILLANNSEVVSGVSNPTDPQIVDLIGFGTANYFEGTVAPALSNSTAGIRANNGCQDTNDNGVDFVAAEPNPRNSSTALNTCILGVGENGISNLRIYPNPVVDGTLYINTTANATKAVVIYDVLGKQVIKTTTDNNTVNVSNLKGGVYIVKITEEGKTATRKLVIR